jgi:hypothetical protein
LLLVWAVDTFITIASHLEAGENDVRFNQAFTLGSFRIKKLLDTGIRGPRRVGRKRWLDIHFFCTICIIAL